MSKRAAFLLISVLSVATAGYAIYVYAALPLGALVHPEMRAAFEANALAIRTHIFGSALALLFGPLQFLPRLRARRPTLHRALGYVYLAGGVAIGGAAGLLMAFHAFGGFVSTTGFGALAVVWLYTGARALAAVRARRFEAHRRWMIRNFALSFAAVTLRIGLGLGFAAGLAFESFYPWLAWLCWVPNLAVAEWIVMRETGVQVRERLG